MIWIYCDNCKATRPLAAGTATLKWLGFPERTPKDLHVSSEPGAQTQILQALAPGEWIDLCCSVCAWVVATLSIGDEKGNEPPRTLPEPAPGAAATDAASNPNPETGEPTP
jgi:hypothetical protein